MVEVICNLLIMRSNCRWLMPDKLRIALLFSGLLICLNSCGQSYKNKGSNFISEKMTVKRTEAEWRKILTPVQFNILRGKGTERPFSGEYDGFFEEGDYYCAGCGALLFHSSSKYNSGCGWPAFFKPADSANLLFREDISHGMIRTEVMCAQCGGHLGHKFDDGPEPTGIRYCINSVSMIFKPSDRGGK